MLIGCLERFKHWFPLIASGQFDGLVLTIWSCSQFALEFVVILRRQVLFFFVLSWVKFPIMFVQCWCYEHESRTTRFEGRENDVDKDNSTSTMIQQFVTAIPAKLGHVSASLFHINRKILKSSFQRNKRCIFWTSELRVMIVLVEGAHAAQHLRENWRDCLSSHFS